MEKDCVAQLGLAQKVHPVIQMFVVMTAFHVKRVFVKLSIFAQAQKRKENYLGLSALRTVRAMKTLLPATMDIAVQRLVILIGGILQRLLLDIVVLKPVGRKMVKYALITNVVNPEIVFTLL